MFCAHVFHPQLPDLGNWFPLTLCLLQESAVPTEKKKLEREISCLVCSQQQPMLLLVGTVEGNVSLLDMRKGAGHGTVTPVHSAEVSWQ